MLAALALAGAVNVATASETASAAAKKPIYALVSAVGDQFSYVRQKESTGSNNIDNNIRRTVKIPNNALNVSVLRGLDSAIAAAHPDSERILIALSAVEMDGVLPQNRESVAIGKIVSALEKYPGRASWEKILVATPKYLQTERAGMGPKLHGLGVYVQPLVGGSMEGLEGEPDIDVSEQGLSDTINPTDGKKSASKTYIAPFSYIQVYVIDPKTMTVLEKNARHDYQKLHDPNATAIDVGDSITLGTLAKRVTALAERSAARAVGETEVGVTVLIREVAPPAQK